MAKTPASRKAKGRRLQQETRDKVLALFEGILEVGDVLSTTMGDTGSDLKLSPLAKKHFPFSVECKNTETLNIWKALEQAEKNAAEGTAPLVIFKRNRSKIYAALDLDVLLELLSKLK